MKKIAVLMMAVLAFGVVAVKAVQAAEKGEAAAASGGAKLGYVDMNRALNEVAEGKAAKAKLEADGKAKKAKLEIMQNELKAMKEDLDKQKMILSKEALAQKEQAFQQKFFELQKTSAEFEKQFAEAEATAIRPIGEKLQRVIQQVGSSQGFALIVPREMALYSLPGTDLTEKVIAAYNTSK